MKLFLTTAVLAATLATSAYAGGAGEAATEAKSAPSGQLKVSTESGKQAEKGQPASSGAKMDDKAATSGAGTPKDTVGSKDAPGDKTGVSGGAKN